MVVPHGTLFGTGVAARIKADLLEKFNLHTIVRLPEGVFAPYTDIAANILFFDTTGPTGQIAYWEQPAPEGRRKYSKTAPLLSADLADLTGKPMSAFVATGTTASMGRSRCITSQGPLTH